MRSVAILGIGAALLLSIMLASGEMPYAKGFGSSVSTDLGLRLNLSSLYENVNSTSTYRIDESDNEHLRWRLGSKGTVDSAIVFSDGRIQVGSRLKFSPSIKDQLDAEMSTIIQLLNTTGKVPDASRKQALSTIQYYSGDNVVDAESWRQCGDQVFSTGDYAKSLIYYNKSLEADQSNAESCNNKGAALAYLGSYQEAMLYYDKAINESQTNSIPWNNKGIALYNLGRADEALDCLNRSCSLDQGNARAWYNKGVLLSGQGKFKDALESYNRSIGGDLYYPQAWNNKGLALMKLSKFNEALDCFSNAINLNQGYAEAWTNAGLALQMMGLDTKSKEAFSQAEKLGYEGAKDYQWAGLAPLELMTGSNKSIPGPGWYVAAIGILMVFVIIRRRR